MFHDRAYVIEKRDVTHGGGWVPAVSWVDPKQTHANVPRLLEGNTYEFRVRAENMQGQGEPLTSDKPVTAKASAGELSIQRTVAPAHTFFFFLSL